MNQIVNRGGQNRIPQLDYLRGFAIILMVIGHSFIRHPIDIHDIPWCTNMYHWINTFHMELFFLISGCVYKCVEYKRFISKKVDRILIPYFFFGLIALILHSGGSELVNRHNSFGGGLFDLLFKGGSYWFLYVLFIMFSIYPFIEKLCGNKKIELLVGLGCIVIQEVVPITSYLRLHDIFHYLPYFILGRYAVDYIREGIFAGRTNRWVNATVVISSVLLYFFLDKFQESGCFWCVGLSFLRALSMMVPLYITSLYLLKASEKGMKLSGYVIKFLDNCSKNSLQLYLFNGFLLVIIRTILCNILKITNPVVVVSGIVVGDIAVTLVLCNYIIPKLKYINWLCGLADNPFKKKDK